MSGASTQVLDIEISQSVGSDESYGDDYYWLKNYIYGFNQIYYYPMPFSVSRCDITVLLLESNKIHGNAQASTYNYEFGTATTIKPTGSTFIMNAGDTIDLATLTFPSDEGRVIDTVKYQLKLHAGYIEYGLDITKNTSGSYSMMPHFHLFILM